MSIFRSNGTLVKSNFTSNDTISYPAVMGSFLFAAWDTNSHLLKHSIESGHKPLEAIDYKIIGTGYRKNTIKRKLSEALFIKELKPTLNQQEKSLLIKLFN